MTHGGYTARIEFDERDKLFIGRVLGLDSIVSFQGETVAELQRAFEAAVEDYLKDHPEQAQETGPHTSGH